MRTRRKAGFTLLELMISTALVALAAAAMTAGFLSFSQMLHAQEGIRGGQASARQALHLVATSLRRAGYGIEPPLAFAFPESWKGGSTNKSDRLVFFARDPRFNLAVSTEGASADSVTIAATTPLEVNLYQGDIIQVVCPGASDWSYGVLSENVAPGATALPLESDTGEFPYLNDKFDQGCFDGGLGAPAHIYKVDRFEYWIEEVNVDGVNKRPYLFRRRGGVDEPVAEDIEAFRVTFIKADGTTFVPDPEQEAPGYHTPSNDPLRFNDHPANIRTVRIGLVARASLPDQALRRADHSRHIPAFAGVDAIDSGRPGFRRLLYESSIHVRNLASTTMFIPPYTADTTTTNVCQGASPSDGLNCAGG
ncbi:MAG: prepilin-type N-terminal cleavage/methylation domain-containing protein [Myxococcales bacterium]|jgi:type IV pilus assembly protein PilW